jgi:hypothetical protein
MGANIGVSGSSYRCGENAYPPQLQYWRPRGPSTPQADSQTNQPAAAQDDRLGGIAE